MRALKKFGAEYRVQLALLFIFIGMLVIFIVGSPRAFGSLTVYFSNLIPVVTIGIFGIGITLLVTAGEFDLSFPSVAAISGFFLYFVWASTNNLLLAILSGVFVGCLVGLMNGLITVKFKIPSLLVTLGMMITIRGVVYIVTQGYGQRLIGVEETFLCNILVGKIHGFPIQFIWLVVLTIFFWSILNRHKIGNWITCTGDNPEAAREMGINTGFVKILCFILVAFLASLAGIMITLTPRYFTPTMGDAYLFYVIAAVFIGGTLSRGGRGSLVGTFIGAFIIQFLNTGLISIGFTGFQTYAAIGAAILIALIINSIIGGRRI